MGEFDEVYAVLRFTLTVLAFHGDDQHWKSVPTKQHLSCTLLGWGRQVEAREVHFWKLVSWQLPKLKHVAGSATSVA